MVKRNDIAKLKAQWAEEDKRDNAELARLAEARRAAIRKSLSLLPTHERIAIQLRTGFDVDRLTPAELEIGLKDL